MIIKGGARKSGRFFAGHLMKAEDNERVAVVEMKNLWAEDVPEAFREMKSIAKGTRADNYFYTVSMNPRADESLTAEQWDMAVDRLEHNLGLDGHARFQVEHEKADGRIHRHIVWSRVDADTMTVTPAKNDYYIHMQTGRELEREFNHQPTPDPMEHGHRAEKEFSDWELFRGQDGRDPKDVKAEVTALFKHSDSGVAFVAALEDSGYTLCQGERGYCIIDSYGDSHSLVRRLEGIKTAELREYLSSIPLVSLPTVAEAAALVRERNEAEEEGGTGGAAQPTSAEQEEPQQWINPKFAVLEKFAHDHPAIAPPDPGDVMTSSAIPLARSIEDLIPPVRPVTSIENLIPPTYPPARSAEELAEFSKAQLREPQAESPHTLDSWQDWAAHAWQTLRGRATDTIEQVRESLSTFWQDLVKERKPPDDLIHEEPELER